MPHLTRDQLEDLLTTAALVGMDLPDRHKGTRGDVQEYVARTLRPTIDRLTLPVDPVDGTVHDVRFATQLTSDDRATVQYLTRLDGHDVVISRYVTRAAYRSKDRVPLWEEDVVRVPRTGVVRDLVADIFDVVM